MGKTNQTRDATSQPGVQTQRIDKWLWAARFFKTRALAAEAVKKGKVLIDGEKIKPGRDIKAGMQLSIRQSCFTKTVDVLQISPYRGPASVAAAMYRETDQSVADRERLRDIQQSQPALRRTGHGRPTKRERRQIIAFTAKGKS